MERVKTKLKKNEKSKIPKAKTGSPAAAVAVKEKEDEIPIPISVDDENNVPVAKILESLCLDAMIVADKANSNALTEVKGELEVDKASSSTTEPENGNIKESSSWETITSKSNLLILDEGKSKEQVQAANEIKLEEKYPVTSDKIESEESRIEAPEEKVKTPPLYTQVTIMERKKEYAPLKTTWEELTRFINSDDTYLPSPSHSSARRILPNWLEKLDVRIDQLENKVRASKAKAMDHKVLKVPPSKSGSRQTIAYDYFSEIRNLEQTMPTFMDKFSASKEELRILRMKRRNSLKSSTWQNSSSSSEDQISCQSPTPPRIKDTTPRYPWFPDPDTDARKMRLCRIKSEKMQAKLEAKEQKDGVVTRLMRKVSGWFYRKKPNAEDKAEKEFKAHVSDLKDKMKRKPPEFDSDERKQSHGRIVSLPRRSRSQSNLPNQGNSKTT